MLLYLAILGAGDHPATLSICLFFLQDCNIYYEIYFEQKRKTMTMTQMFNYKHVKQLVEQYKTFKFTKNLLVLQSCSTNIQKISYIVIPQHFGVSFFVVIEVGILLYAQEVHKGDWLIKIETQYDTNGEILYCVLSPILFKYVQLPLFS